MPRESLPLTVPSVKSKANTTRALLLSLSALLTTSCAGAQAANAASFCNAAICEDEASLISAVDAALDATQLCETGPTYLLSTLYLAPYTAFSDGVRGRGDRRGIPSSPAILRLEDLGILNGRRFRHKVSIVDSAAVRTQMLSAGACLVVASPPLARFGAELRVVISITNVRSRHREQRFLYLRRESGDWIVTRNEIGYQT
jgi:hypothetical protein